MSPPVVRHIARRLGTPPRPPRPPHYSEVLKHQVERRLALLCGQLGCAAIEARVMWVEGDSTVIARAEAGACEADVARLKRTAFKKEDEV